MLRVNLQNTTVSIESSLIETSLYPTSDSGVVSRNKQSNRFLQFSVGSLFSLGLFAVLDRPINEFICGIAEVAMFCLMFS